MEMLSFPAAAGMEIGSAVLSGWKLAVVTVPYTPVWRLELGSI